MGALLLKLVPLLGVKEKELFKKFVEHALASADTAQFVRDALEAAVAPKTVKVTVKGTR